MTHRFHEGGRALNGICVFRLFEAPEPGVGTSVKIDEDARTDPFKESGAGASAPGLSCRAPAAALERSAVLDTIGAARSAGALALNNAAATIGDVGPVVAVTRIPRLTALDVACMASAAGGE